MQPTFRQTLALMFLRATLGFLMIWWGLSKALELGVGKAVSDNFYGGAFSADSLLIAFGWVQVLAGAAIVAGLFLRWLLPFQLLVNGFSAASVWYAILDPFKLYLPPQSDFPFTQLFYPSIIIVAACLLLMAFRGQDRLSLDGVRSRAGRADGDAAIDGIDGGS